jgi:hypothetical protein
VIGAPVVELGAIYHLDGPKASGQAFLDLSRTRGLTRKSRGG